MEQLQKDEPLAKWTKAVTGFIGQVSSHSFQTWSNLQLAFQKSIQQQLARYKEFRSWRVILSKPIRLMEETTRKQSQVVQGLIVQVMDRLIRRLVSLFEILRRVSLLLCSASKCLWTGGEDLVESVADVIGT